MNARHIALDLDKTPCPTPVLFRHGDRGGVTVTARITDGGINFNIEGSTVKLVAMCTGGNVELPCTVVGNVATVTFGEAEIDESCEAFMRLIVGERRYSTGRFQIRMTQEVTL